MTAAPNYRHGGPCCAGCEYGIMVSKNIIAGITEPMTNCSKYGLVMPAGVCDDWEED